MSDIEDFFGIQHTVTVTSQTRRGITKVAGFTRISGRWYNSAIGSAKQMAAARRGERGWSLPDASVKQKPPDTPVIHLVKGLDVPKSTMDTILEVVRKAGKHQVDVAGIRVVVSKLGGRAAAFNQLSPRQRRHAETALYTQILDLGEITQTVSHPRRGITWRSSRTCPSPHGETMPLTPVELSLRGRIAAHTSWANTPDRPARTAKARKALEDKFLAEADGDPKRAEHYPRAYYARLALKSAQARRRRGGERQAVVQSRLAELDGGGGNAA